MLVNRMCLFYIMSIYCNVFSKRWQTCCVDERTRNIGNWTHYRLTGWTVNDLRTMMTSENTPGIVPRLFASRSSMHHSLMDSLEAFNIWPVSRLSKSYMRINNFRHPAMNEFIGKLIQKHVCFDVDPNKSCHRNLLSRPDPNPLSSQHHNFCTHIWGALSGTTFVFFAGDAAVDGMLEGPRYLIRTHHRRLFSTVHPYIQAERQAINSLKYLGDISCSPCFFAPQNPSGLFSLFVVVLHVCHMPHEHKT